MFTFFTECATPIKKSGARMRLISITPLALAGLIHCFSVSASAQTFEDTQRLARAHHPSLQQAKLEIDLAREDLFSARASRGVSLNVALSSAIQSVGTDRAFATDIGETFVNSAQIEAVLPLYTSGELTATIEQARNLVAASEAAFKSAEQSIQLAATDAHLSVYEASETVKVRDKNVERLQTQLTAARDRFDIGVITRTDVDVAEARFQAARAGQLAAVAELQAARASYLELTGTQPDTLVVPNKLPAFDRELDVLFSRIDTANYDLQQSKALEQVAELGIKAAESQRKLKVEAFGSAGFQDGSWNNNFLDRSATLGVRASRPIYTGGRLESAERKAVQQREQARLQTIQIRNRLLRELATAYARYQAALSAVTASEKEIKASQTALEGAEIEVGVGLRTTLQLLDQEQDLLDAELRLISARKSVFLSLSQIQAFLGELGVSESVD